MKKFVILTAMLMILSIMFAQNVILFEDFEGTQFPPAGWMLGGGSTPPAAVVALEPLTVNWMRSSTAAHLINGNGVAISPSWYNNQNNGWPTNNWLITPKITLPATAGHGYTLSYIIGQNFSNMEMGCWEDYQVLLSTTEPTPGMAATALTPIFNTVIYEWRLPIGI